MINDDIGEYEIFIGIMWRRFGTPTGVADSGTEEEYRIAYARWQADRKMPLMFYFCQRPFMPRELEELDQIRRVLIFRRELEGQQLAWEYPGPEEFPAAIRVHLCKRINKLLEDESEPTRPKTAPDDETIRDFKILWNRMDPELRRSFSVAFNENRQRGDGGVKTKDLFSAFRRLKPVQLDPILKEIPEEALPEPTSGAVFEEPYIVSERPWLSPCIASSVRRLGASLPVGRELSVADVFVDIAKHGHGDSVEQLRRHAVGPAEIDSIVRNNNIDVVPTGGLV